MCLCVYEWIQVPQGKVLGEGEILDQLRDSQLSTRAMLFGIS